ncbi:MAG TPA: non-heme iron oxygenase ferredoxin subunit [Gammaproteobacteria bacterium]|jgi:3-phenylpropionate/trans-cinnamate dioxygenase ferredoxin subunit
MADWVDVATADEFPPGTHKVIDVSDVKIAVFNVEGKFYAIEDVCTHDGGVLTGGPINGCIITCPRHGATFDIRNGAALTAPAYEPTASFPVRIQDGMVQTQDDRWD